MGFRPPLRATVSGGGPCRGTLGAGRASSESRGTSVKHIGIVSRGAPRSSGILFFFSFFRIA